MTALTSRSPMTAMLRLRSRFLPFAATAKSQELSWVASLEELSFERKIGFTMFPRELPLALLEGCAIFGRSFIQQRMAGVSRRSKLAEYCEDKH